MSSHSVEVLRWFRLVLSCFPVWFCSLNVNQEVFVVRCSTSCRPQRPEQSKKLTAKTKRLFLPADGDVKVEKVQTFCKQRGLLVVRKQVGNLKKKERPKTFQGWVNFSIGWSNFAADKKRKIVGVLFFFKCVSLEIGARQSKRKE